MKRSLSEGQTQSSLDVYGHRNPVKREKSRYLKVQVMTWQTFQKTSLADSDSDKQRPTRLLTGAVCAVMMINGRITQVKA